VLSLLADAPVPISVVRTIVGDAEGVCHTDYHSALEP
jgi:hypothetical protein